jgi:hypothetical protein
MDASGAWLPSSLGYRLNNPGNLNYAGQPGASPTAMGNGSEAQFATLDQGIAATENQLSLDASRGLTLSQRLTTWATGNPAAYVSNVSGWLGVDPNTPLSQLVGQDSITPSSGSAFDFSGNTPDTPAPLSGMVWVGLAAAALGLVWASA